MMDNLYDLMQFALELSWYRVKDEVSSHFVLIVAVVAIILLFWIFISPAVRHRG